MPRILSRNSSLYKRKGSRAGCRTSMPSSSFLSPASSVSPCPATQWYSVPIISRDEEEVYYYGSSSSSPSSPSSRQPYCSSSASSSICSSNSPSIPYYIQDGQEEHNASSLTRPRLEQRRSILFSQTSAPPLSNPGEYSSRTTTLQNSSPCEDDVWGHFVDTAEAEAAIIRHSKILSKLYSM